MYNTCLQEHISSLPSCTTEQGFSLSFCFTAGVILLQSINGRGYHLVDSFVSNHTIKRVLPSAFPQISMRASVSSALHPAAIGTLDYRHANSLTIHL